jgi:toxin-antitoxin system, toxin component, Txe/YoeB family
MAWKIVFSKKGQKDLHTAIQAGFGHKINELLTLMETDPLSPYPPYEKLLGDMAGAYSRRINIQHRIVYQLYPEEQVIKILSMWLHYQ